MDGTTIHMVLTKPIRMFERSDVSTNSYASAAVRSGHQVNSRMFRS